MKRNRFTDEQIIDILKEPEAGTPVSELCRKQGVSDASIVLTNVDDCTRECLGLVADISLCGLRVARELDRIIEERGKPKI